MDGYKVARGVIIYQMCPSSLNVLLLVPSFMHAIIYNQLYIIYYYCKQARILLHVLLLVWWWWWRWWSNKHGLKIAAVVVVVWCHLVDSKCNDLIWVSESNASMQNAHILVFHFLDFMSFTKYIICYNFFIYIKKTSTNCISDV